MNQNLGNKYKFNSSVIKRKYVLKYYWSCSLSSIKIQLVSDNLICCRFLDYFTWFQWEHTVGFVVLNLTFQKNKYYQLKLIFKETTNLSWILSFKLQKLTLKEQVLMVAKSNFQKPFINLIRLFITIIITNQLIITSILVLE